MPRRFKVGYQIHPQHGSAQQIRDAYRNADSLGVDCLYVWDHMHALYGDSEGIHYSSTPILAGMAVETRRPRLGALVTSVAYRNPEFYAYEVWTINQLSGGRAVLGIGAGWFERDYREYGYEFGDAPHRLRELGRALPRVKERLRKLDAMWGGGQIPIMIGGGGEKVTLRLTAEHADIWNTFPPLDTWKHKNQVLNDWCDRTGRDQAAIERTCSVDPANFGDVDGFLEAGAEQLILRGRQGFPMQPLEDLLKLSGA
jgi:probable F420-dependent oxidoreductase